MLRLSVRGFAARKLRIALTVFAVALGVALISGTYVLTDTINRSFDSIFQTAAEGTDVSITARDAVDTQSDTAATTIDARFVDRVRGVEGVGQVNGSVETQGALFADGERIGGSGAPTLIFSSSPEPFSPLEYTQGRAPRAAGEVVLLESTAKDNGVALGDTVQVVGDGPRRDMDVVGLANFGGVSSFGGAIVVVTTLGEAQDLAGLPGRLTSISVAGAGEIRAAELRDAIRGVAPATVAVRTGQEDADRQSEDIREGLGFLRTALLAFAGIALFVGAFIIFNTFSITVAQRMREFALLRTLGASRRQIMRQVLFEGLVIGLLGSVVGLLMGLALAPGLRALFKAVGADLPSSGTVVEPRTIIVALLVGTVVTVVAGLAPAVRATQVPPVAALREGAVLPRSRGGRLITPGGALLVALGAVLLGVGLFGAGGVSLVGGGAVAVFLGVALLSPKLVPPLAATLGRPLPGVVGRLARENVVRQPGRTAVTASALMIGVTLVAFVSIFAAGAKATIEDAVDTALTDGTLIVQNTDGFTPIGEEVARTMRTVAGAGGVSSVKYTTGRVDGVQGDVGVSGVDPSTLPEVFNVSWTEGSAATLSQLDGRGAVLSQGFAEDNELGTGDTLRMLTPTREQVQLTVRGVVDDSAELFDDVTVTTDVARDSFGARQDSIVFVASDPSDTPALQDRIEGVLDQRFPIAETLTAEEFNDRQAGTINQLLGLIYVLLSLAVIVSLFGIVNTLVLSIFERTRELGMLRAIGTSRRQVRRMIRYEAVITSLIGAVIGIVLGVIFAVAIAQPLEADGFQLQIPGGQLVVLLVLGAVAGILAAVLPARRASRLQVLDALAYE
jgi:putative ABC transport system permease protein